MNNLYDIIVIGGGPAGISAGIYAHRAGMKVLVIDGGNSSLEQAKKIDNYYGIESISGKDLIEKGINQYKALGGEFLQAKVVGVRQDFDKNRFTIKLVNEEYVCRAVILCMGGNKKITPSILQDTSFENVSYCAICDGFFYKGQNVAVIGDGEFAAAESEELAHIAKNVCVLTDGNKEFVAKSQNVKVISNKMAKIIGNDRVESIIFEDGTKLDIDGVFIALGTMSSFALAKQLGVLMNKDYISVDKNYMTNIAGVFAGGDSIGGLLQVAKAVSDGAGAGLEAARYIKIMEYNEQGK